MYFDSGIIGAHERGLSGKGIRRVSPLIDDCLNAKEFMEEYVCTEEVDMEENLIKFLMNNDIDVDKNGNFEMFVVVPEKEKDCQEGAIFNKPAYNEVYFLENAYKNLKINRHENHIYFNHMSDDNNKNIIQKSIRENLLEIDKRIFKVLINKSNVQYINNNSDSTSVKVNRYKIISEVELEPKIAFEIDYINGSTIRISLYNTITDKKRDISIHYKRNIPTTEELKDLINDYLNRNEKETKLINETKGQLL